MQPAAPGSAGDFQGLVHFTLSGRLAEPEVEFVAVEPRNEGADALLLQFPG